MISSQRTQPQSSHQLAPLQPASFSRFRHPIRPFPAKSFVFRTSRLPATYTKHATLTPLEYALTTPAPASPLESALPENPGGGGYPLATRHRLHIRQVHIHRHRSLDQLQRHHHPQRALFPLQHPLQPRERPPRDPHPPAHRQERMRFRAQSPPQPRTQDLHLFVGKRRRPPAEPHQPHHPRNLQNPHPLAQRQPYEHVSRKQRQVQRHPPILPPPHRAVHRQKMFHRSDLELRRNLLLMIRARVRRVPVRIRLRRLQRTHAGSRRGNVAFERRDQGHSRILPNHARIQLRPVTYRGRCDLTLIFSAFCSRFALTLPRPAAPSSDPPGKRYQHARRPVGSKSFAPANLRHCRSAMPAPTAAWLLPFPPPLARTLFADPPRQPLPTALNLTPKPRRGPPRETCLTT